MTGGTSPVQWEDITGASPLTLIDDCVNFTTNISARFWLIDCPNAKEAIGMATELYREAMVVPFISKFVLFAKRRNLTEARLRVFCVTDDKMEKTLESQEHFVEVARSRDVEVLEGRRQFVEVIGNMSPIIKTTTEPLCVSFRPFRENRLPLVVRLRDLKSDPAGQVLFIAEPRGTQGMTTSQPPAPICVLNVVLPGLSAAGGDDDAQTPDLDVGEIQLSEAFKTAATDGPVDQIKRAELRLTDIADALQSDWVPLARQLGLTQHEIIGIQRDFSYVSEQALVVLHLWVEKNKEHATGNELERALKRINREDIIDHCMRNLKVVTDEAEKQQALAFLEADMVPSAVTEPEKIPVVSEPTFSTPIQESAPPAEATYSTEPVVAALPSVAESDLGVTEKLPVEEVTSPAVEPTDSSVWAEQVPPSTSAELQAPVSEEIFDLQEDVDVAPEDEVCGIRVYTDTTAGVPQVETDVQETEEVLPDGTVIRRKVIKTQQRQLISTRVVMEGPEDVLPATKAEAEQFLGEMEVSGELSRRVMSDSEDPQVYTNVEEHEEVLPDGSIVKRRVVTTTRHHVTTEKMALEDEGAFDIPADNGTTPAQGDVGGDHATR
jgi:hypothetical protein